MFRNFICYYIYMPLTFIFYVFYCLHIFILLFVIIIKNINNNRNIYAYVLCERWMCNMSPHSSHTHSHTHICILYLYQDKNISSTLSQWTISLNITQNCNPFCIELNRIYRCHSLLLVFFFWHSIHWNGCWFTKENMTL